MDWSKIFLDFAQAVSPALQTLLEAVFVALASAASAYMYKLYQTQRAKLSSDQQFLIDQVVSVSIRAVEQMYGSYNGDEKKAAALAIAEKTLAGYGLNIELDTLSAQIESAVYSHFPKLPQG